MHEKSILKQGLKEFKHTFSLNISIGDYQIVEKIPIHCPNETDQNNPHYFVKKWARYTSCEPTSTIVMPNL